MACEQRLRAAQGTQLLPNVVSTEQQSLIVVKKLLAIAVSSITYLRGLFPEKAYGRKFVEEQKVMILREERTCPGASQIVQWMQGCFDALQRKYYIYFLIVTLVFLCDLQKVTECYQFKVQYTEKGPKIDFESKNSKNLGKMACSNTKKSSILLVRKLYTLMQNLGPLPDNVCLNMKLSYYDDVTPQDYQPPGFMEGDSDSMQFEKEPVNLTMAVPFPLDKWELKMEEGTVTKISSQQVRLEMDTLVKRTSDLEVAIKRTRSGRVTRSTLVSAPQNIQPYLTPTGPVQMEDIFV
uniref:HORMA domain containing 1 n=1 Tax=Oncorhynchus mykiss TaxID=8022 RepID=A0A8C7PPD2_ONCMY